MTFINRLLIAFITSGLLAVGYFTFGENGILNNFQAQAIESSFEKTEDVNKIPASALEDPVYTIDKNYSHLMARLYKAGIASAFAHDHVVSAGDFSGQVVFNKDQPDLFKIKVEVSSSSLVADSPKDRQKYNLGSLEDDDRKEINETMKSSKQMDVEKYPKISFSGSGLHKTGKDKYTITGDFTLHGTTKEITVPVTINLEENILKIKGEFRFLQSEYGIEPYSAGWGAVRNKDEVLLLFDFYAKENM